MLVPARRLPAGPTGERLEAQAEAHRARRLRLAPFADPTHQQAELLDRLHDLLPSAGIPHPPSVAVRPRERLEAGGRPGDRLLAGHERRASQHARGAEEVLGGRPVGTTHDGLEPVEAFPGLEREEIGGGERVGHEPERYQRLAPRTKCAISSTAMRIPTITARLTMLWPMLSSSISGMAATGTTFR